MTAEKSSLCSLPCRLWRTYRTLPLADKFKWEWYAFSLVAAAWTGFCIAWAVLS